MSDRQIIVGETLPRFERAIEVANKRSPAAGTLRAGQFWYTQTIFELPVPATTAGWESLGKGSGSQGQGGMSFLIGRLGPQRILPVPGIGLERVLSETWVGLDGTTRTRLTALGPPRFTSANDRARFLASHLAAPRLLHTTTRGNGYVPPGLELFSYRRLLALPTNPRALNERLDAAIRVAQTRLPQGASILAHEGRDEFAAQTLFTITSLLEYPLPPQLRAALYRAAALVPGTRYDGTAYDLSHRPGAGISVGGIELIFNPATGALLGQRSPGPGGETIGTALLATGIADAITARPATH